MQGLSGLLIGQSAARLNGYYDRMRIATYNVNNIRKRFTPLAVWRKKARPEVVCLQVKVRATKRRCQASRL
jgi:hypothetical protein